MADYTATTSMNLETAISNGPMANGENLTITSQADVTCTQTPSILMGRVIISDGRLIVDGSNISAGNMINFVGELGEDILIQGQGTLVVIGDWYTIGTTDGTDSQTFDLSTYYNTSVFVDHVPMIQVETGRRIDYDNVSGTTPEVDDMVYKSSDRSVFGRIVEVNTGSSYVVVKWLTGTLANDDEIQVRKVVDNFGPDLQVSWTADVNNASGDIKEAGIYQEFGNSRANGTSYIANFGHGVGGFVFDNQWQSTTLTMGTSLGTLGGFVPPSGCTVRIPNVHFSGSDLTNYPLNSTAHPGTDNKEGLYYLDTDQAGSVDLSICNIGTAYFGCVDAFQYDAEYVGTHTAMGSARSVLAANYTSCVVAGDPIGEMEGPQEQSFCAEDMINGINIIDCLKVKSLITRDYIGANASFDVVVRGCIATGAFAATGPSSTFVYAYNFEISNDITFENNIAVMADSGSSLAAYRQLSGSNTSIRNFYIQTTQDGAAQIQDENSIAFSNSENIEVIGVEYLNDSYPGRHILNITDTVGIKLRCIGMIDDKLDRGTTMNSVLNTGGYIKDLDIARIWVTNNAAADFVVLSASSIGVILQNCSADYASAVAPVGANDVLFAGFQAGSGNPGSGSGIEDFYEAKYGRQIHDGFRSDTLGNIYIIMIAPSDLVNNVTVVAGTPRFFKDGDLDMASGDIIEFEQDYFAKGHTGFTGDFTAAVGNANWFQDEWVNIDVDFQYDINDGNGWNGTWLDLRTPANLTGISVDPGDGVKLKFRLEATGTQTGMSILVVDTTTTITDQKSNFYPIDQNEVTVQIVAQDAATSAVIEDARVLVEAAAGGDLAVGTNILSGTTDASGIISRDDFVYTSDQPITIKVRKATTPPYYKAYDGVGVIGSSGTLTIASMIGDGS